MCFETQSIVKVSIKTDKYDNQYAYPNEYCLPNGNPFLFQIKAIDINL
jgi:hypothetical protein